MKNKEVKSPVEYDKMHRELMDYILSGQMHSTLIGKTITMNHSDSTNDLRDVEEFVEYVVSLIKRAEQFRKDNVKKS